MAQVEKGIGRLLYDKMDDQLRTKKFSEKLAHLEQILNLVQNGKFLISRISRLLSSVLLNLNVTPLNQTTPT
eukprot:4753813-Ditylum_brightwellii.AAC.1